MTQTPPPSGRDPAQLPGRDAVVISMAPGLARELVFHRERIFQLATLGHNQRKITAQL